MSTGVREQVVTAHFRGVLFTDLDGTLLDASSYQPSAAAIDVLGRLVQSGIAIVVVSSKTTAELTAYRSITESMHAAVLEGGAVMYRPPRTPRVLGPARKQLVEAARAIRAAGVAVRNLADMDAAQVAELTGLTISQAVAANRRLASEPCVFENNVAPPAVARRLATEHGAQWERGGRLWHLQGIGVNKGSAVRRVMHELFAEEGLPTAAIGDAWNDLPMLEAVDLGMLLGPLVAPSAIPDSVLRVDARGPDGFVVAAGIFMERCGLHMED